MAVAVLLLPRVLLTSRIPTARPLAMSATEKVQDQLDTLADSRADSTDSEIRYLAYGARLRTALRAGSRYVAYVSTTIAYISIARMNIHSFTTDK
jgi:hypothetical protein